MEKLRTMMTIEIKAIILMAKLLSIKGATLGKIGSLSIVGVGSILILLQYYI